MTHSDVLIVGGGVIGLSLAYDLARHGRRVRLIDRSAPGQESSWAGAGILPPAVRRVSDSALEQLTGMSHTLHAEWAERLRAETGVDNGYRRCGGLYLGCSEQEIAALRQLFEFWQQRDIAAQWLSASEIAPIEPALCTNRLWNACFTPEEVQIRNPRHVQALLIACGKLGVEIEAGRPVDDFQLRGGRIVGVTSAGERRTAEQFCIAGGAWTRSIVARLGLQPAIKPIRGQIVLLASHGQVLTRIVNDGPRYLVPRPDGRVLVGSTEEDAGFDKRTTSLAVGELIRFAIELVPQLSTASVQRCWAGLRPGSADGLPYLGRMPGLENGFIAAGHFRQGLHLSTGTAVVMSQLLRGERAEVDLAPFSVDRNVPDEPRPGSH